LGSTSRRGGPIATRGAPAGRPCEGPGGRPSPGRRSTSGESLRVEERGRRGTREGARVGGERAVWGRFGLPLLEERSGTSGRLRREEASV